VAGADPAGLAMPMANLRLPPHRVVEVGRCGGVPVLDASMAATPAKGAAALDGFADASVVLVAGGTADSSAGPVHTTPEERELLEGACAVARRVARQVVIFGPASDVLAPFFSGATIATGLEDAIDRALSVAAGAEAVVVAPMFPVTPSERDRVAEVVRIRNRK
jgi:UDP-N-acetylmuramoylalanine-D-glutamate ligase